MRKVKLAGNHKKRPVIVCGTAAMIGALTFIFAGGMTYTAVQGKAVVENMEISEYKEVFSETEGASGEIRSADGQVLWSSQNPGYEDTFNLIGTIRDSAQVSPIANSVSCRYEAYLFAKDDYKFDKGFNSLKNQAADVNVTLNHQLNERIWKYMKENGVQNGFCLCMDQKTGAILTAVSLPTTDPLLRETPPEGSLYNKNLSRVVPGSTMKVVTAALLAELHTEKEEIADFRHTCEGSYPAWGGLVTCQTGEGEQDLVSALGCSCNAYFADAICRFLNPVHEKAEEQLEKMGFVKTEQVSEKKEKKALGLLSREKSVSGYQYGSDSLSDLWSLIGQGKTLVSPIDMVQIVSAIAGKGETLEAYLVDSIVRKDGTVLEKQEPKKSRYMEAENAEWLDAVWRQARSAYYGEYHPDITAAKTGTCEVGKERFNRLLAGYSEKHQVSFYIAIYDYETVPVTVKDVARELMDGMAELRAAG